MKKNKPIVKEKVQEEWKIGVDDLSSLLDEEVITKFLNLDNDKDKWDIKSWYSDWGDHDEFIGIQVILERDETDKEFEKRKEKLLKDKQYQKEKDLEDYNRLKKKLRIKD